MVLDYKWVRPDMDLFHVGVNSTYQITFNNSGKLEIDFYNYACNFYDAAHNIIHYLCEEAATKHDIRKLDLWYFAMIYLYRQSLELLLKASIFQTVTDIANRKEVTGRIRHDLKQAFETLTKIRRLSIDENENAKWLMNYLSDISKIDKESDMFRYPFGNSCNILFKEQTNVSLVATHNNMTKAYHVIKSIYDDGVFTKREYEANLPQLIIEGGRYYQQSVVGYEYNRFKFHPYFSSYMEVGNYLRDIIITKNENRFFMPMCYLYRNAIELGLKRLIIEDSHMSFAETLRTIRKKKHSILGLWNSIREEIKKYANSPEDDDSLNDSQQYIQAFHNFDQSSDLFRYPCNKNMSVYFLQPQKFDIKNVSSCFEELCHFLDAVDTMISELKGYETELANYYDY